MSLKNKVRLFVTKNESINKVYGVYHQYAKYMKARKLPKVILNDGVSMKRVACSQSFFGYYDKPAQFAGKTLYHHQAKSYSDPVGIYVDERKVSETRSWNWQQGSMATWLDERTIIHNDFVDGRFVSKIVDIETFETRIIDYPIYQVHPDKRSAMSLNFSRLASLRPDYGYFNLPYDNLPLDDQDGLFEIDLVHNTEKLLLSIDRVKRVGHKSDFDQAIHKLNHVMYSPKGSSIIFLHRYYIKGKKTTRLMHYVFETDTLSVVSDHGMVSHCNFIDEKTIIGYLSEKEGNRYYVVDLFEKTFESVLPDRLIDDGHPTITSDGRYMITDTYPDHEAKSKLLLVDLIQKEIQVLGAFYSPMKYKGQMRCDLHPRLTNDHTLTFDSVHEGLRGIYELDFSQVMKEEDHV